MVTQSPFKNKILPYFLLAPSFIIIGYFLFYPTYETFRLSLYRLGPFAIKKIFIKFDNFVDLLTSADYLHSFKISFVFSASVVVFGLAISLGLAVLINRKIRGINFYRTALIWPYALSPAIAGALWVFLFDPSAGYLNYFFSILFDFKPKWLTTGSLALVVVTAAATWKNIGYNIVFFLAGLQNVPKDIQEAAGIDGANRFQVFWRITFPLLSPMTFFLLIMNLIYSYFGSFGLIHVMTEGGPANATNILIYDLYKEAFINHNAGLASAESIILFVLVFVLTLMQFGTSGRGVHYQ
ncbi:MAG: sugar ABC transporter permease [Deltaproteobacteria bacterium]|jgi:sn-glycerol 3-phosphate transport system permease protein